MALRLHRYINQAIIIGNDIIVSVHHVGEDGRVVLSVEAPRHVSVDRLEVRQRRVESVKKALNG
jgi:carbon storage regulator CsrA